MTKILKLSKRVVCLTMVVFMMAALLPLNVFAAKPNIVIINSSVNGSDKGSNVIIVKDEPTEPKAKSVDDDVDYVASENVAKVGNTEYATIDEAIANWTNGTTLTLLADVTLSDVITLKSTEHHILNLGTYTMTAAKNKDAIQYVVNGRSSLGVALDIKADATNPGGITASGGAVVRHTKPLFSAPTKDRPITRFYGGIFNASYVVRQGGTISGAGYTGASAPSFQFYGGEYNGTIYTNRSLNQFYGGTFNGSLQMSVDSSAYTLIAGGTFKNLSNLMNSELNDDKFMIASHKCSSTCGCGVSQIYDKELYIDDNGNYVIATPSQGSIQAAVAKTPGTNDYLAYSKVATESALNYTNVETALKNNKSATVTVYADEVDMSGINFTGTIVVPEGNDITITNAPSTLKVQLADGTVLTPSEDGTVTTIVPTAVATYDELVAALANGGSIKLTADIAVDTRIIAIDGTTIDLNGKTLYINVENSTYGDVTIKNGNIVLGKDDVHVCDGYFVVNAGKTLVVDGVKLSSSDEGIKGYAVFHLKTGANLDLINSELNISDNEYAAGYIVYAGESTATVDVVDTTVTGNRVNGIVHAATVIKNSTFTITNAIEHGINRSGVTITDSTVAISGGTGRGITAQHGSLVINGNSTVTIKDMGEATIELRNNQNLTIANTATVNLDAAVNNTTSGTITGTVTLPPQGNNFNAYTGADGFWGEVWGNAKESFVIKVLDKNDNVMGTASLNNIGGIIDGDVNVTWNLKLDAESNTDEYWDMEWTTAPTADNMPAKVELWVDGVKVSGGDVKLNGPDGLNKIVAAVVDGEGKIIKKYATTLNAAVAAVADGGTIVLVANEIFTENNRTHNSGSWYDGLYYIGDKSFTIDLRGFTISQNGAVNDYLLNFKNDGLKANTITLKNGTIDAGASAYCAICTSTASTQKITINLENINVINNNSNGSTIKVRGDAVLNVNAGTVITGKNSYLGIECVASTVNIYDGAKIYMNGTSSYNGCLVGACGGGTVNVYGGYGKGVKGGFIAMTSGGTINISGGEWIANTNGAVGNNSNVYVLTAQNNKNESGYVGASIINVSGGTFRGGMDAWVLNDANTEKAELNISGGNFNANPSSYVADGYVAVEESDGTYKVVKKTFIMNDSNKTAVIYNLEGLKEFAEAVNGGNNFDDWTITLAADIDLAGEAWTPIGTSTNPFCGMFDGDNHTISNLVINGDKTYVSGGNNDNYKGLFGYMKGGNNAGIKNVTIQNAKVTGCLYVGVILGRSYTGGIIENCHVKGLVQVDSYAYAGGIVGRHEYSADANKVAIKNCSVDGTALVRTTSFIKADYTVSYVGGIVGFMAEGKYIIDNCNVKNVAISGVYGVGGISGIGHYSNEIKDATVDSITITSTNNDKNSNRTGNVGLIVGATQGTASNPTVIQGSTVSNTTATVTYTDNTSTEVKSLYGTNMNGTDAITNYVAQVNGVYYESLQAAINAVQNGETITLLTDIVGNVTLTEKVGLYYTIDGNGKTMNGKIIINSLSDTNDNRRITIKNINFVDSTDANVDFISSVNTNHYPRLTIEGCSFTGSGNDGDVAVRLKSSHSVIIKDCTGKGLHSFLQNTSGWNLTVENVTVTESKGGLALGTVQGVTVKDCDITVGGYGVRIDADTYNNNAVIESNTVEAFIPVVVRKVNAESNITFKGTNTMTASNTDGIWCAIGTTEYETNGSLPTAATGKVKVTLTDTSLDKSGIYGAALNGSGTAADPYQIGSVNDLILFRDSVNKGETKYNASGVYVVLTADIDLAGENWVGIGSAYAAHGFMGNFDGKGFKIKNLTITNPTLDSDGYAYAGLFSVTEGIDKDHQNTIKNLIIENVTISTTGHIVAAAIAYPYYTIVENVTVCGDINIKGGDYTAGALAYTRRCINASNVTVSGNAGSTITGKQVVGGVISDIQMNGGLIANYSNFSVSGVKITGEKNVGGISGIIATQTLNGATVNNVTLVCSDSRVGIVAGCLGGTSTISNVNVSNVDSATAIVGGTYDGGAAVQAKIGDTYYATFADAFAAAKEGETITLLADITISETITINKNLTIDGNNKIITYTGTDRAVQITGGTVVINDLTVTMTNAPEGSRGINLYNGGTNAAIDVTLNNVTVNGGKAYAVNFGGGKDNKLTIKDSTLTGYAAINVNTSSVNHTIAVEGSTLNGKNHNNNYHFGTVVVDGTNQHSLTITNSAVTTENLEGVTNKYYQVIVGANCTYEVCDSINVAVRNVYNQNNGLYYIGLASAIADAEDGATIVLLGDETISETIKVNANITLDLNGKTITGTDNATGSFALIEIQPGKELTINDTVGTGKITLTATNNRGWGGYSSVISNQRGKLVVENGTIEHLGGTDMAYAIDNLTNGKGTYAETVINGGTIKSTYRAIRQFLNGVEAENILTINGGTIEGTNKSIWMQNANANVNPGKLNVYEDATLKGNVLISGSSATAIDMEVSISANALAEGSTVEGSKLPATVALKNTNGIWGTATAVAAINGVGYATLAEALAAVGAGDVVIELVADATLDYNARDAYGAANTTSITINGNGHTLTLNQKNSDWSSVGMNNARGKLTLKNMTIEKTGYGDTSGAWNTHAIIFSCNVEMTEVTVNNAIAVQNGATLNDVIINEANGYYGLWINGNGQTVTMNGGAINATNGGRGIKIADQYIDAPASVKLTVNGTKFNTAKKAAVLVSSTAGAVITADNVDITNVAEDKVNFAWVDEDWAANYSKVTVSGTTTTGTATLGQEAVEEFVATVGGNYYKNLADAFAAAKNGDEVVILKAGIYELSTSGKNITITGEVDGVVFDNIGAKGMDGASVTFNNVTFDYYPNVNYTGLQHAGNLVYNNCTINGQVFLYGASETFNNCTFNQNSAGAYNVWTYGAKEVTFNECIFNSAGKSVLVYTESATAFTNLKIVDTAFTASAMVDGKAAIEIDTSLSMGANIQIDADTTATGFDEGSVSGNSLWNNKKGNADNDNNDITVVVGGKTCLSPVFVAQIGDTKYMTLAEAIAAAQNGNTIYLIADVVLDGSKTVTTNNFGYEALLIVGEGKNITIDFNGNTVSVTPNAPNANGGLPKTIEAVIFVENGASLTLKGGTGGFKVNKGTNLYSLIYNCNSTLTIEGGNYWVEELITAGSVIYADNGHKTTINGGVFFLGNAAHDSGSTKPWIFNTEGKDESFVLVNGGTFNQNILMNHGSAKDCEVKLADGTCLHLYEGNGTWTVKAHKTVNDTAVGATCTTTGLTEGSHCSNCGEVLVAQKVTNALGHTAGTAVIENEEEATVDSYGRYDEVVYCTVCGAELSRKTVIVDKPLGVAQIGNKHYATLAAAIAAAKDGDTIKLLADIDGNVTIGKNITIDGANFNYTGTMNVSNGKTVTIKNVNFVKGCIDKAKGTSGTLTVNNCTFDGVDNSIGYAVTMRGGNTVTLEDCTVKNYNYGMLYVPSAVSNVNVKNTTVEGVNYGVHVAYGSKVNLENVTMTNVANGIMTQNYGAKTITIKNSNISSISVWERNTTVVDTFVFLGNNTVSTLPTSAQAKLVLGEMDATLTAPEGATVTTTVECREAEYKNGAYVLKVKHTPTDIGEAIPPTYTSNGITAGSKCSVCGVILKAQELIPALKGVAQIGNTYYETFVAAIAAAKAGDTIKLLADITADVTIKKDLTIDGGNFKYTGNISVNGKDVDVIVKNVKFVNGTGYAITTNTVNSITVENCTVTNYAFGFLYANKSTPTVMVKDVTVDNCNYGFHWVYGSKATLENVTMTNVQTGLYIQNYASKTITLKNCDITSIAIWERAGYSGVQTFNFEGKNTVGTLSTSQYAKYVLAEEGATLTAPEVATVTTEQGCLKEVVYENGSYKVKSGHKEVAFGEEREATCISIGLKAGTKCETCGVVIEAQTVVDALGHAWNAATFDAPKTCTKCGATEGNVISAVAQIGEKTYATLAEAIAAAQNGDTIKLIANISLVCDTNPLIAVAGKEITIDLNGFAINVNSVADTTVIFSTDSGAKLTVKDSSEAQTGSVFANGKGKLHFMFRNEGTMVIESGNFYLSALSGGAMFFSTNNNMTVKGGNFMQVTTGWMFNTTGNGVNFITVTGGTFNRNFVGGEAYGENPWGEVKLADGLHLHAKVNGTWTVEEYTVVDDEAVNPTCTETGLTAGSHCGVCGEVLVAQTVVDALGHTEVADAAVGATCTETGLTAGSHCGVCNEVLVAQTVVDALGHTWVDATVDAPKTCSVCGEIEGEALEAVAQIGNNKYATLEEALAAANAGDTVDLLQKEVTYAGTLLLNKGITLNLNGNTLTVDYLVAFNGNHVVDTDEGSNGLLKIGVNNLSLTKNNANIAVYDSNDDSNEKGYRFAKVGYVTAKGNARLVYTETETGFVIRFMPGYNQQFKIDKNKINEIMSSKDGVEDSGVQYIVRLSWTLDNGVEQTQDFVFSSTLIADNIEKSLSLTVNDIEKAEYPGLKATIVVKSDTGAESCVFAGELGSVQD